MQTVQLDSLLPAIPQNQTSPRAEKSDDTAFEDALKASTEELEQSTAVSKKEDADGEKNAEKTKDKKDGLPSKEESFASGIEILQQSQKNQTDIAEKTPQKLQTESEIELNSVSDAELKWISEAELSVKSEDEISSEDFAKLADAALKFIAEKDTDEKLSENVSSKADSASENLLEDAQALSLSDPKKFLENAEIKSEKEADFALKENVISAETENQTAVLAKNFQTEAKNDSAKKQVSIQVTDLRTQTDGAKKISEQSAELAVEKSFKSEKPNLSWKQDSANSFQVTMDLSAQLQQETPSLSEQTSQAANSAFKNMVAESIQQNAPDFVKAGNIILKDNSQGSINLVLHPEKLGNVKINLTISDKVVSGSILVHSKEAYDAIKDSIGALKNAFAQSGMESGEFNLNFSSQNSFADNSGSRPNENQQAFFQAGKTYGDYTAAAAVPVSDAEISKSGSGLYSVDIVA